MDAKTKSEVLHVLRGIQTHLATLVALIEDKEHVERRGRPSTWALEKVPADMRGWASALVDWLKANECSDTEFAVKLHCTPEIVRKWLLGKHVPRTSLAFQVEEITGGTVKAKLLPSRHQAVRANRAA